MHVHGCVCMHVQVHAHMYLQHCLLSICNVTLHICYCHLTGKNSFDLEKPHAASRSDLRQRANILVTIEQEFVVIYASFHATASSNPHPLCSQKERGCPNIASEELMPYH